MADTNGTGILSSVFSLVSREVASFVHGVKGTDPEQEPPPVDNARRVRKKRPAQPEASSSRAATTSRRVGKGASSSRRDEWSDHEESEDDASPSPPPPPPRVLKRRKSITMPGSLFPRSASLEPPTPCLPPPPVHRVRFDPPSPSPPSTPRRPSSFASTTPSPRTRKLSGPIKAAVDRFHVDGEDADPSILLPSPQKSPHVLSSIHSSKPRPLDRKGKQREDVLLDDIDHDSSGYLRVQGKQRELVAAKEDLDRKERRREYHEPSGPVLVDIERERERDKERIRMLEDEIQRLKQELSKRPSSSNPNTMPIPPPPPPPPPMPPKQHTLAGIAPAGGDMASVFASARASLKHAPPPVENPINPLPKPRRPGMPTVGLAPDKMAAFLTEMKTVRLRKVPRTGTSASLHTNGNVTMDISLSDLPPPRPAFTQPRRVPLSSQSFAGPSSMREAEVGDKRKRMRADSFHDSRAPLKRRTELDPPLRTSSLDPPHRAPQPSSHLNAPTPSLCSDLDTSPDEQPPSTPPVPAPAPLIRTDGPRRVFPSQRRARRQAPDDITMADESREFEGDSSFIPASDRPRSNLFDKRLPTSPFPDHSPRRPRPPSKIPRLATKKSKSNPPPPTPPRRRSNRDTEDEDRPLAVSYSSPDEDLPVPIQPVASTTTYALPPPPPHSPTPASSITHLPARSRSRSRSTSEPRPSAVAEEFGDRRRSLAEELRTAFEEDQDAEPEEEEEEEDLPRFIEEEPILTGTGMRSRRRGFLARGGGGGEPVFMGVGYVDGAREEEDEEEPVAIHQYSSLPRRVLRVESYEDQEYQPLPPRKHRR